MYLPEHPESAPPERRVSTGSLPVDGVVAQLLERAHGLFADNADGEIDEEPRAATLDDESGQPSGDQTNEQIPEKIHGQNEFW